MTLRQIFLEYAQKSLEEDFDLSGMPLAHCGWFFFLNTNRFGEESSFPYSFWQLRQAVLDLIQEGLLERHPNNKYYVRIKC